MKIKVVLEGCNSDWSQKHYLPILAAKARQGSIELWAIDVLAFKDLAERTKALLAGIKARYVNKVNQINKYEKLREVDCVFIVAPNVYHCEIARFWLDRLSKKGRIYIEKPLDDILRSALRLQRYLHEHPDKKDKVYAFDHYLPKIHQFLLEEQKSRKCSKQIGSIERLEFRLLEPFGIPSHRVKTLDKGMIFDLFCHVLAVVGKVVAILTDKTLLDILRSTEIEQVKAARYSGCPISGETFAKVDFITMDEREKITGTGIVGKAVGTEAESFLKLYGSTGAALEMDFSGYEARLIKSDNSKIQIGILERHYVEVFLNDVLKGIPPLDSHGVFGFDEAVELLAILDEIKLRISKMPEYFVAESVNEILARL